MENTVDTAENTPAKPSLLTTRIGGAILDETHSTPVPGMLFSEFWSEGELSVLFGSEGVGKSLLAVQVAEAVTKSSPVNGFTTDVPAQKALYFDFSTSDRQFARRYKGHRFSDNFIRVTLNPHHWELRKFGEQLVAAIETAVQEHEAKVIIIDSLATLKFFVNEVFLFSHLRRLKDTMNLSVLLLAGAKKIQAGKPLSLTHLAANKMLCGIADSIFAMGETLPDADNRYLIHLKGNEYGRVYHEKNVIIGRTSSPAGGIDLPGFEFIGYETEQQQLELLLPTDGLEAKILEYRDKAPQASLGEIAKWTGTHKMKVKRVLEKYHTKSENLNSKSESLNAGAGTGKANTVAPSFSSTGLKPGGPESSILHADSRRNVNLPTSPSPSPGKTPVNTAVTAVTPNLKPGALYPLSQYPERGNPSDLGEEETLEESLKTLDAMITNYCKTKPAPKAEPQKQLTYSQQLKKRLAEARKAGKK